MKTIASAFALRRLIVCMLWAAGTLAAPYGYAQVNKCVDAAGKVVGYGSDCPSGTKAEATNIRNVPSAPAPGTAKPSTTQSSAPKTLAEQEADFRKRQTEKQEAQAKTDKLAAEREARTRACENSRSYLKSLQSGTRITKTDPKTGERSVFEDADYARETVSAQRAVDANCK